MNLERARSSVGTSVRLVGGEWKFHYVRRTRDVAGRNRKHQDRVKRKRNTMFEKRVDHEECLKHTKKATQRETKADDMMSTTFTHTHTQYVEDRVKQREVNRSGAERGTTLEELQENANQKIPQVTRNQTADDGKHRDEFAADEKKESCLSLR